MVECFFIVKMFCYNCLMTFPVSSFHCTVHYFMFLVGPGMGRELTIRHYDFWSPTRYVLQFCKYCKTIFRFLSFVLFSYGYNVGLGSPGLFVSAVFFFYMEVAEQNRTWLMQINCSQMHYSSLFRTLPLMFPLR